MPANVESMFYYGETPWHRLGVELKDIPTSEKAIRAAGLNWKVTKEQIVLNSNQTLIVDHFAIKRSDKNDSSSILGIVGKRYEPVQNSEAFEFFDQIVGKGGAIYHTAGSLDSGKIIWILAKLPAKYSVSKNDDVDLYTLLMNKHDGTGSVIVQPTPIRVVCQNTLNMALLNNQSHRISFIHTKNVKEQMEFAAITIKHANELFSSTIEAYSFLAKTTIKSEKTLDEYFDSIITNDSTIADRKRARLTEIFNHEIDRNKLKPSLWLAYNAVTQWVDHEKSKTQNKRLYNAWFGSGYTLKQNALDTAMQLAQAA